ncbi:hypothetical protein V5F34_24430 [Xanthobacter autotrophicus]|uniref:hypothetical protein n=1 Tax=Xanthobacter autotrophicus TaxID=280 RepID=UPI003726DB5A
MVDKHADSDMVVGARALRKKAAAVKEASVLRNPTEVAPTDPVAAVLASRLFRRLFLDGLRALHAAGRLTFRGDLVPLADTPTSRRC